MRALSCYDFKVELGQEGCLQYLQIAYEEKFSPHATPFTWFMKFRRGQSSLLDEEHTWIPLSAVIPENVLVIRNMLVDDNCCP